MQRKSITSLLSATFGTSSMMRYSGRYSHTASMNRASKRFSGSERTSDTACDRVRCEL